jgi:hypothetical protein
LPCCSFGLEETCMHLFFECTFSQDCWTFLGIFWNLNLPPLDMVIEARTNFGNIIFREIVIAACWIIWTSRNRLIFDNIPCNMDNWKARFKEDIGLICIKAKPNLVDSLIMYIQSLA